VPHIRPFRALRYDPVLAGGLAAVVAPPYDVIGADEHRALLARHSRNAVRIDLPADEPGDGPDDRYRRAAHELAAWRSDGTLRKDVRPALYVIEQTYRVPGVDLVRTQRGFMGRLRLEPLRAGGGILPHERTLSAPREDRYKLLRATGTNTSPVVALFGDPDGRATRALAAATDTRPDAEVVDDEEVRTRLWVVPDDGSAEGVVATLAGVAGAGPVSIADGHHRYETALRYRDERRMTRSGDPDPAFDYVLACLLATDQPLTVLPTHRVVRRLGDAGVGRLETRLGELFAASAAPAPEVVGRFEAAGATGGGRGRFGLLTRSGAWFLEARRDALAAALPSGGDALRALDVTLLGAALDRLCGLDREVVAQGDRVTYTKAAAEAAELVAEGRDDADAAFLLEPTPVAAILDVARDGDVMPQKSTYFYPKVPTGLVFNPHEW
jgi:uncharacterized protein (DUF1015 family)